MRKFFDAFKVCVAAIYAETKNFFSTPLFFILLGCAFLFLAGKYMEDTHPSFIFLLAILGISIVLYGTGTQGVGSANFQNVPVKVAVAGGAGVLAGVFGFGILWQSENIQKVFQTARTFGLVELKYKSERFDLTTLRVSARSRDGKELPHLTTPDTIKVLVPITFTRRQSVCVTVLSDTGKALTAPNTCPQLVWRQDADNDYSDFVKNIGEGELQLNPPPPPGFTAQ